MRRQKVALLGEIHILKEVKCRDLASVIPLDVFLRRLLPCFWLLFILFSCNYRVFYQMFGCFIQAWFGIAPYSMQLSLLLLLFIGALSRFRFVGMVFHSC